MPSETKLLIIRNENGEVIGAQLDDSADGDIVTFISPTNLEHTLYGVSEVPSELLGLSDPIEFHRAVTDLVNTDRDTIRKTSFEELNAAFSRALDSPQK